jgi:Flp pilus assembly protein TadD
MSAEAAACFKSGNLLVRQGRLEEAQAAYERAVALQSDHAEARYNLGVVLRDQGRMAQAQTAFGSAIDLRPDHAESHNNLGMTLAAQGRHHEAVPCFERSLALKPDHARALSNLGVALMELDQPGAAAECFRRAVALKPDFAKAHNNLGVVLQQQGRFVEARSAFTAALNVDPAHAEALFNLCGLPAEEAGSPDDEATFDRLRGRVEVEREPVARGALLFAMGQMLERRGDVDGAFDAWAEANGLRRAAVTFDIAQAEARMAAIADGFDEGLFSRLAGQGLASERPIFILGMPRSGTTLVEQILAAHPQVHGAGELRILGELAATAKAPGDMTGADCLSLGQAYLDGAPAGGPGQTRVTDKAITNFQYLGLVQLGLPRAAVVHCRRDPRDVGLSCFATRFSEGQAFTHDLAEFARYWRAYDRLMDHWRAVLPPGRLLEVPYEGLAADLEPWARRLIAHCGLEWDDACLRFHEAERTVRTASLVQVRRPIHASSVGRWRRFAGRLGPLLRALGPPWDGG